LERAVTRKLQRLLSKLKSPLPTPYRVPIGLLLLSRGLITDTQLREALAAQRGAGRGKLGDWLIKLGSATEDQITSALGIQWGCPVYPFAVGEGVALDQPLPLALLNDARVLPVHYNPTLGAIHIAFLERVDYNLLYVIEQMTGCKTVPCVSSLSAISQALASLGNVGRTRELVFEAAHTLEEMARIVRNYASALGALEILVSSYLQLVWFRLVCQVDTTDVLFRNVPSASYRMD